VNEKLLKARIVEKGFTQSEIADKIGISATAFNNKITGKVDFKASEISKLSDILDIDNKDAYFFN
jgi:transcriptional regulator with XRE-family HTH domain